MDLSNIATDTEKEKQGVLRRFPGHDVQFRIASLATPAFTKYLRAAYAPLTKKQRENPDVTDPILQEGMARHILLGWEGELKNNGQVLKNDLETRRLILANSRLRNWISEESAEHDNYLAKAAEEEDAELGKPSSGC